MIDKYPEECIKRSIQCADKERAVSASTSQHLAFSFGFTCAGLAFGSIANFNNQLLSLATLS